MDDGHDPLTVQLRTGQILIVAMVNGLVVFLGVVLIFLKPGAGGAGRAANTGPLLTYLACGFAAVMLAVSLLLRNVIASQARRRLADSRPASESSPRRDIEALNPAFQTQLIAGVAPVEGAEFFACIAYMLEGSPIALGLAALLIAILASRFPRRTTLELWLMRQLSLLDQERQLGG